MTNNNSNNAIVKVNVEETTAKIEKVLETCNAQALAKAPPMTQAVMLAQGIESLRRIMTEKFVNDVFMPLQGTPLGFVTDRDNPKDGGRKGYDWETVRDCMIEGMIKGLRPVNNEINIIAGRAYAAKNGVSRLVSALEGVTDLRVKFAVPSRKDDEARVQVIATWNYEGTPMKLSHVFEKNGDDTFDGRISVRVNKGMGNDAILGKAKRKLFYEIHEMINGTKFTGGGFAVDQGESDEVIDTSGFEVSEPMPETKQGQRVKLPGDRPSPSQQPRGQAVADEQDDIPPEPQRAREPGDESEQNDSPPEPPRASEAPKDSKQQATPKSGGKPSRKRRRTQPAEETVSYDPETGEVDEGEPAEQDDSLFNR